MFFNKRRFSKKKSKGEIFPDEIMLDSRNLPSVNNQQLEGRLVQPIEKKHILVLGFFSLAVLFLLFLQVVFVQVVKGGDLAKRSEINKLSHQVIFPERGYITDRYGELLAWNQDGKRLYSDSQGLAHVVGFVGLPNDEQLSTGRWHPEEWIGQTGVELTFNDVLAGQRGVKIEETDARGQILSDHVLRLSQSGNKLELTIDASLQEKAYEILADIADDHNFTGGAFVMMDVNSGELISLVSYPEFSSQVVTNRDPLSVLQEYFNDSRQPFLNRALSGVYTPGSIVKPYIAVAALEEGIIRPDKAIVSSDRLEVANPYFPDQPSIFMDWENHGSTNLRQALAVSSNIYFYYIGGGYGDQPGLGISRIYDYGHLFGLGQKTGIPLPNESKGIIPNPEWKASRFDGDAWRLGDTYHTAIGQFGFLVTPIQMARLSAAIASGRLLTPALVMNQEPKYVDLDLNESNLQVVREGMRMTTTEGTARSLNIPGVQMAVKTGTAEIDAGKKFVNSWMIGFWPMDNPVYAFALVMERGSREGNVGAGTASRRLFDWIEENRPEYFLK
ncbi:MAG: penicillin-binding transpeptidase domain-containing protein [Patescibacteria group bacterium]